jgi:pyruvate/2-oxoglutarate/acetoin dehydrogenase E1 component
METKSETLRDVIKETVRHHLTCEKGLAMGQCLTAVGWVGGTLPELYEEDGMVELSMADVAGAGFAVGAALAGKRPIYVIRYQGFNWYNAPIIANYACKSKEIWRRPCAMFIRSIAMEGGIGPVAGSSHHAIYYRMPGIRILSPMTPDEYREAYREFMANDDVYYISEHRGAYPNTQELLDTLQDDPDIILFPISITRFAAAEAARSLLEQGIRVSVAHIFRVKPFAPSSVSLDNLRAARFGGIVLDDDYPDGIAKTLAHDLSVATGAEMQTLGLDNRSAGFDKKVDNLPPDRDKIIRFVLARIEQAVADQRARSQ